MPEPDTLPDPVPATMTDRLCDGGGEFVLHAVYLLATDTARPSFVLAVIVRTIIPPGSPFSCTGLVSLRPSMVAKCRPSTKTFRASHLTCGSTLSAIVNS
jgi:hypothetical protein